MSTKAPAPLEMKSGKDVWEEADTAKPLPRVPSMIPHHAPSRNSNYIGAVSHIVTGAARPESHSRERAFVGAAGAPRVLSSTRVTPGTCCRAAADVALSRRRRQMAAPRALRLGRRACEPPSQACL